MLTTPSGVDLLRDPERNKGLGFTRDERELHRLNGLLSVAIQTLDVQVHSVIKCLELFTDPLSKYIYLRDLQDRNELLFYSVLQKHITELMPLVYTPTVGLACERYSLIYKAERPRGLFLTADDTGRIGQLLGAYGDGREVKAIVVTDGERILGLGDLGANGMGIPVGKIALYTAIGGIPPQHTLPITLDVGTNNPALLEDPDYIGLRRKRLRPPQYDALLDEFMKAVVTRWGPRCLIQFEDFGNANAHRLLKKYKMNYCTFNDDIQGTAAVAIAGVMVAFQLGPSDQQKIHQNRFLFFGAGEAALGIADLLVLAIQKEIDSYSPPEAQTCIAMFDSQGLITPDRVGARKDPHKERYSRADLTPTKDLLKAIDQFRPTVLIGAAAQPAVFTEPILRKMAQLNARPIIFALSNPTSKAECTAEEAYKYTDGRAIFASGSPFDPVTFQSRIFHPGQGNNVYIYPAVALAVISCQVE